MRHQHARRVSWHQGADAGKESQLLDDFATLRGKGRWSQDSPHLYLDPQLDFPIETAQRIQKDGRR